MHKQRDVTVSFAQRRERDRKHIQSVVEIEAKPMFPDPSPQVVVGRRQYSHIHSSRLRTAESLEFKLLKSTQELGLKFKRQLADALALKANWLFMNRLRASAVWNRISSA